MKWRAPEEYRDQPLNEKIDVWSIGCNMHSILTGLNPLYTVHKYSKYRVRYDHDAAVAISVFLSFSSRLTAKNLGFFRFFLPTHLLTENVA